MISAILLFGSGVSLLATLIGGLKYLFSSFALSRYAQLGYSEYGFFNNICLIMAFPELFPMSISAESKRAEKMLEPADEGS